MTACNTAVLLFGIAAFASLGLWWFERIFHKRAERKIAKLEYELEIANASLNSHLPWKDRA